MKKPTVLFLIALLVMLAVLAGASPQGAAAAPPTTPPVVQNLLKWLEKEQGTTSTPPVVQKLLKWLEKAQGTPTAEKLLQSLEITLQQLEEFQREATGPPTIGPGLQALLRQLDETLVQLEQEQGTASAPATGPPIAEAEEQDEEVTTSLDARAHIDASAGRVSEMSDLQQDGPRWLTIVYRFAGVDDIYYSSEKYIDYEAEGWSFDPNLWTMGVRCAYLKTLISLAEADLRASRALDATLRAQLPERWTELRQSLVQAEGELEELQQKVSVLKSYLGSGRAEQDLKNWEELARRWPALEPQLDPEQREIGRQMVERQRAGIEGLRTELQEAQNRLDPLRQVVERLRSDWAKVEAFERSRRLTQYLEEKIQRLRGGWGGRDAYAGANSICARVAHAADKLVNLDKKLAGLTTGLGLDRPAPKPSAKPEAGAPAEYTAAATTLPTSLKPYHERVSQFLKETLAVQEKLLRLLEAFPPPPYSAENWWNRPARYDPAGVREVMKEYLEVLQARKQKMDAIIRDGEPSPARRAEFCAAYGYAVYWFSRVLRFEFYGERDYIWDPHYPEKIALWREYGRALRELSPVPVADLQRRGQVVGLKYRYEAAERRMDARYFREFYDLMLRTAEKQRRLFDDMIRAYSCLHEAPPPTVDLGIARLDGTPVPEDIEHAEGSIVQIPDLDGNTAFSRVAISMDVDPPGAISGTTFALKKVGPTSNVAGKVRILKDGAVFMSETETEKEIDPTEFASRWEVQAVATGVVDLVLVAEGAGNPPSKDQVRVVIVPVAPKEGRILLVSANGELDLPEFGFKAERTIAKALEKAAKVPEKATDGVNVAIARSREPYKEHGLEVPANVLVVGLGGEFVRGGPEKFTFADPAKDDGRRELVFILPPEEFNFADLPTIDGGGGRDVVVFILRDATVLAGLKITGGHSFRRGGGIRIVKALNVTVQLNEITENKAGVPGTLHPGYGGGIYVRDSQKVRIFRNRIHTNAAQGDPSGGGGIFIKDSLVFVTRNTISSNKALTYGGGIGCRGTEEGLSSKHVYIGENKIEENSAGFGGGIGIAGEAHHEAALLASEVEGLWRLRQKILDRGGGIPTLVMHNIIANNVTRGGDEGRGGGIYNGGPKSVLRLSENRIESNESRGDGGGIVTMNFARVIGQNNVIFNNSARDDGGGISHGAMSKGRWEDNLVSKNKALRENGGGLHASVQSKVEIKGNTFFHNQAKLRGGGLYLRHSALISEGENTIVRNEAGWNGEQPDANGGGIAVLVTGAMDGDFGPAELTLSEGDKVGFNTSTTGHGGGVSVENLLGAWGQPAVNIAAELVLGQSYVNVSIQDASFYSNKAHGELAQLRTAGLYVFNRRVIPDRPELIVTVFRTKFLNHEGAAFTAVRGVGRAGGRNVDLVGLASIGGNFFAGNHCGMTLKESYVEIIGDKFDGNIICHINVINSGETHIRRSNFFSDGFSNGVITQFGVKLEGNQNRTIKLRENNFVGHNQDKDNSGFAVFYITDRIDAVDGRNNWWGNAGGPHVPPLNNNLKGARIRGNVTVEDPRKGERYPEKPFKTP